MIKRILAVGALAFGPHLHASQAETWWDLIEKMRSVECEQQLTALRRGQLVHRTEGETFDLDRQTVKDLEVKKLLFPLYADDQGEVLGRGRLMTMLKETAIDPDEIRLRREAVRELEEDEATRFDIRAHLKQMEKWSAIDAATIKFVSGQDDKPFSKMRDLLGAGLIGAAAGTGAYVFNVHPEHFKDLVYFSAVPAVFGFGFIRFLADPLSWHRARHAEIKTAMQVARRLAPTLARAKSARLREIAAVLDDFDRKRHDSPAQPLVRSYLPLRIHPLAGGLLDYTFASALTLRWLGKRLDQHRFQALRLFSALSEAAALSSIATYGVSHPELNEAEMLPLDGPVRIEIAGGHHPHILRDKNQTSIPNDVTLAEGDGEHRGMILTDINRGGKSTVMRLVASLTLMAQMGSRVPAKAMRWTPAAVATNMAITDSVEDRESFFEAQSKRVAEMIESLTGQKNALIIMDEIFTGTSPEERAAGERGILRYLEKNPGRVAILASHDRKLGDMVQRSPILFNRHVGDVGETPFVLHPGVSKTRNALEVMKNAGVPEELLALIREEMGDLARSEVTP